MCIRFSCLRAHTCFIPTPHQPLPPTVDVVSINIPLGFRTIDGQPPHTTPVVVCPQEPTALYRKLYAPVQPGSTLYVWKPDEVRPTAAAEGRDFSEIMAGHATVSFLQARFTDVHV